MKGKEILLKRPPMQEAIVKYCLDCSGGIQANRMFCRLFHCPLWFFRLAFSPGTETYEKIITSQWENGEKAMAKAIAAGSKEPWNSGQVADAVFHLKESGISLTVFLGTEKAP